MIFELERLKREGKDVGFLRRRKEITEWEKVEARVDQITAKDMKPRKANALRRLPNKS